ncbi:hypothetical protein E2C01_033029 [Portunus trituberculatus]|uniref:Uncharacterized protein n=1 Tax=Portunus trituberculatus TaxID=210409 RepID=A0A5B7EXH2_PORTR|nr:hypothetical protein [Portunus trituberculatus]
MEVCCPDPAARPVPDPAEPDHQEKRRHIDPAPANPVMELKVCGQPHQPHQADHQGDHHGDHHGGHQAGHGGGHQGHQGHQGHHTPLGMAHPGAVNGHLSDNTHKNESVYDFDPEAEEELGRGLGDSCDASPEKGSVLSETSDSTVKNEPELEGLEDSEMADEEESVGESYEGSDYPGEPDQGVPVPFECVPRRGRGRPRGSKNRVDGRGRGRGYNGRLTDDRSASSYDLRNIPDPFNSQRRGRPRSRFIVDLGEQNHEVWTKSKEELNISDAELTTLLLSL